MIGVVIFATITNLFAITKTPTEAQNMVKGGIIVLAVLIQQLKFKSVKQMLSRT
jgi:ribose transport system permease protein